MCETAKTRAKRRGVPFNITPEDIAAVWPVDDRCPVLGLELVFSKKGPTDASPSLDRVNPAWGYVRDNIAVVSHRANSIKRDGTAAEHTAIADWMRGKGLA